MKAEWAQLPAWPYAPQDRIPSRFQTSWSRSLDKLQEEIERVDGKDVLIGAVIDDDQLRLDGTPRANFRVRHPGAEVSFTAGGRRLTFHTDRYPTLHDNIHAIASGLEALRAVERHGITTTGQQYAGFQQLGAGDLASRGRELVQRHGGVTAALKATHPDKGGNAADFAAVDAYRKANP